MFLTCSGYVIYSVMTNGESAAADPILWGAVTGMVIVLLYTYVAICGCLVSCYFQ